MTMFGMICTDAYFGYRLEFNNRNNEDEGHILTYKNFLYRLAYQLIHPPDEVRNLRRRRKGGEDSSSDGEDRPHQAHNLRPLSQTGYYAKMYDNGNKSCQEMPCQRLRTQNCLLL